MPKGQEYYVTTLRERLRRLANDQAAKLSRSVDRKTSVDEQPCVEYVEEVANQYKIAERLFYYEKCRATLERALATGRATLSYKWVGDRETRTTFARTTPGHVEAIGLEE